MTNILANIARVASATTGTGTLTLGSAITGFNTFVDAGVTDGQTVTYAIEDYNAGGAVIAREVGAGVFNTAGPTLTRATVYSSTNAGSRINCSGLQHVFITVSKEDIASIGGGGLSDGDYGDIVVSGGGTVLSIDSAVATTFGRSLMDDADNTAARSTLGLGTAATQNTGTSGATIPLLNGANTWSGQQIVDLSATSPLANGLVVQSTEDGASSGPGILVRRISTSPAANDQLGFFQFQGRDSGGTNTIYASVSADLLDPTDTSEDGGFSFNTMKAGTVSGSMSVRLGALVGSPTGGDQGVGTLNAVTLYENGTSLASKYQPLDSELTAIAGLTSAADRLPYFTGSGTAALATFTTAGRNLLDDADSTAQRTTLGLGTAATQNTGTSGANVPLMNAGNTWSGSNNFTTTASFGAPVTMTSTNDDANEGPFLLFRRGSATVANNDRLGAFSWQTYLIDTPSTYQTAAEIGLFLPNATLATMATLLVFKTRVGGSYGERFYLGGGLHAAGAAGGDQGTGTLNATTLYENGTSLAAKYQAIDTDLTAIAGLATNGLIARTGSGTASTRTITAPAAGITVSNGDGVSGNPTLALANDLAALEALSGTNTIYYRSGADTWSAVTIGANLTFSGGTLSGTGGGTLGDGDYGDITVSVSGTVLTIDNDAVTYAKMQNAGANTVLTRAAGASGDIGETSLAASQLLGRGATGDIAAITLGTNLSMSGATLNATGGGGASATTVEVDLGSPKFTGKFTITDAAITATSKVLCWQAPGPYTGKGTRADEAEMQPVEIISVEPATGSAVVKWQTPPAYGVKIEHQEGERRNTVGATFDRVLNQLLPIAFSQVRLGKVRGNVKFSYTVFS